MNPLNLLLLPGDGLGPEIVTATEAVLEAVATDVSKPLRLSTVQIGFRALEAEGTTLPDSVVDAARAADGVVLGPVSHHAYPPRSDGGLNPSGGLRSALDLFANIRPARTYAGVDSPIGRAFDLVLVRENLEGFYADRNMHIGDGEWMPVPGVALALRKITAEGSERIAERAFHIARTRERKHVTVINKANVMRVSDGLFLESVHRVAERYPDVTVEDMLVDAAAAHLVRAPERFDVVLATNMFGDILSDLASELAGGLGLAASLNAGAAHAVAQAQHGSAPDIQGLDIANPCSLILSTAMLLRHHQEHRAACRIESAITSLVANPRTRTRDIGGPVGTAAFTEHVCNHIREAQA
ncbi:MAG: isocitrate/isopropylmalate family dehydrogenase [Pseudomonadota bacterium]